MSRSRLLFVSPRFLFPMDEGGKIRSGNILKQLKRAGEFEVTLASPAPRAAELGETDVAEACDRFLTWPQRPASKLRRALAVADPRPVAVASDASGPGRRVVAAALAEAPDVVVVDYPHADVLTPRRLGPASVLFTHNVEAEIFERHAARAAGVSKWIWADQARKMRNFEQQALARYDSVIAVSPRDQRTLAARYGLTSLETIDTGVDLEFFAPSPPDQQPAVDADGGVLVFTASMTWPANVEAIQFLVDEVWPRLIAERPRIRALIVGRDPPAALAEKIRQRGFDITLTGYVEDVRPYVACAHVYVIPLFVGSGTRLKAFEAMAMGRPIVSTTVGVEGLPLEDGKTFLRADDAEAFAGAVLKLLDDADLRRAIAAESRQFVERRFGWSVIAQQFAEVCRRAQARRGAALAAGPSRPPPTSAGAALLESG